MITPPHLIFVLSILTKDLNRDRPSVSLLPIISSRRIRHKRFFLRCDADIILHSGSGSPITANIAPAHSTLKFEWPSFYLCVLTIFAAQTKAESLSQLHPQKIFFKGC
eukprot:scaffold19499_cov144-Skeletonema_dohrnii-CCMP3373.AAC.2